MSLGKQFCRTCHEQYLGWHKVEVLPELVHILQVGIFAKALGSSLLLLLLLGLLPLLAGSRPALLLLPLTYLSTCPLRKGRIHIICWARYLCHQHLCQGYDANLYS